MKETVNRFSGSRAVEAKRGTREPIRYDSGMDHAELAEVQRSRRAGWRGPPGLSSAFSAPLRDQFRRDESPGRTDRSYDAPGVLPLNPERRQHIQVHRRAQAREMDLILGHSREYELIAVRSGHIEVQLRSLA